MRIAIGDAGWNAGSDSPVGVSGMLGQVSAHESQCLALQRRWSAVVLRKN